MSERGQHEALPEKSYYGASLVNRPTNEWVLQGRKRVLSR